jgi:alkylhydroperoxidase/carboxymuconolactone decarboxylase family protein YurZ
MVDLTSCTAILSGGPSRYHDASGEARPTLADAGDLPVAAQALACAPNAAAAYCRADVALRSGRLSPAERQVVALAVAAFSGECDADMMAAAVDLGVAAADVAAIAGQCLPEARDLRSLVMATWNLLHRRGRLTEIDLKAIQDSGIAREVLYEVAAQVSLVMLAHTAAHVERLAGRDRPLPGRDVPTRRAVGRRPRIAAALRSAWDQATGAWPTSRPAAADAH